MSFVKALNPVSMDAYHFNMPFVKAYWGHKLVHDEWLNVLFQVLLTLCVFYNHYNE